ncbi:MAG: signal peptidase I [Leptospiraceae bacterium]|nr:signal peptidase I [Leptospiraceae bacterium]
MKIYIKTAKYGLYLFLFAIVMVFTRLFLFELTFIRGNSMHPTLKDGSLVLVYKYHFPKKYFTQTEIFWFGKTNTKRMDLVLFQTEDGTHLVKRVIGEPGDFYVFKNGTILIDSVPLKEENDRAPSDKPVIVTLDEAERTHYNLEHDGRIPPGYFLLLGDNRENSLDSRNLGLIPEENLRGKVVYVLYLELQ